MSAPSPLRRKVALALFAATALALASAAAAIWIFEYRATDLRARPTLESLAETLAPGLVASLDFGSTDVATETLQRLETGRIVVAATLYRVPETDAVPPVFAEYVRPGTRPILTSDTESVDFVRRGDRALLTHTILVDGLPVAILQLEADVSAFRRSLHETLVILGIVLAVLAVAAVGLSRLLQRALTRPLLQLADTVEQVRTREDYSARATIRTRDEIGLLAEGFNLMLAGIEQRDRRIAEQAAFQQAVLDNAGVSIIGTDAEGTIRTFNTAAERWLGYRRDEAVGKLTPVAIHDPAELARRATRLSRTLGRAVEPGFELLAELCRTTPSALEWTYVKKDGTRFPVFLVVSALRAADGRPIGFCGIATDLTERKAAEEAVRSSEERMRLALESSPVGVALIRGDGTILYINRKFTEWFGYTSAELPHTDEWWPRAYPDPVYRESMKALWTTRIEEATRRKGEMQPTEATVCCRDGRRRVIEFRAQLFDDMALVTFTDISARLEAEEAVRTSEERFRIVAEQTGQMIFDQDLVQDRRVWAGAAETMVGYSLDELNHTTAGWWTGRVHPDDRAQFAAEFDELLQHGGTHQFVYRFQRRDERWIYLTGIVTSVGKAGDRPSRLLGTIADVTKLQEATESIRRLNADLEQRVHERTAELDKRVAEVEALNVDQARLMTNLRASQDDLARSAACLQEANANLLAANRELESFSYSVSHDLRAPLRNIAGFIELLRKRTSGQLDAEAERYFGIVGAEAVRMSELIDALLTFSRIGRAELHLAPVRLDSLVNEVQSELQTDLAGRQIDWRIQPMPAVLGDRTLLRQVIANLVANAVKFTRKRPAAVIELGVETGPPEAERLTFFIRDNGAGFDPQYTAKLFGVFQRLHNPREFEGTGIGLANVRRIIERHGGRAWAEGALDQGATFYFTLRPAPLP